MNSSTVYQLYFIDVVNKDDIKKLADFLSFELPRALIIGWLLTCFSKHLSNTLHSRLTVKPLFTQTLTSTQESGDSKGTYGPCLCF